MYSTLLNIYLKRGFRYKNLNPLLVGFNMILTDQLFYPADCLIFNCVPFPNFSLKICISLLTFKSSILA